VPNDAQSPAQAELAQVSSEVAEAVAKPVPVNRLKRVQLTASVKRLQREPEE
jgi:uncharacterized protein YhbP (UPF0306 family)